jgi:hypothetical protein
VEERDVNTFTRTVKKEYPERFDEGREIVYHLQLYRPDIEQQVEQDDVEPQAMLTGHRRIKREQSCEEDEQDEEDSQASSENGDDVEVEEECDDRGDEADELSACEVVTRGLVIQSENLGVERFGNKTKARPFVVAKSRAANGKVVTGSIVKKQGWEALKRSWKWVDGKMVIFLGHNAIQDIC